ncbi:MAG: MFS transporter [Clostridiaceae bacterium]|nr:MFS transporter [Clostridiaceae bacterium]
MRMISTRNDSTEAEGVDMNSNRLWSRSFVFLITASLVTAMGFNMIYTTVAKYATDIGGSLAIAGVVSGIFSIAALTVRPFAGLAADIFNKKSLCIAASVLIGLSITGYAFTSSIPLLYFFRILHGVSFGISSTASIALAAVFIPKERLGEGMGYYGIGQVIAAIIGPNAGLYIIERAGFQWLFYITALLSLLSAVLLVFLPYQGEVRQTRVRTGKITFGSLIAKEVIVYALIGGMFSFGNGIVSAFLVLLAKERNIPNVGVFFSVGAAVVFILRLFAGRIVDKKGLTLVVNISLVLSAISMAFIGAAPTLGMLIAASVLKSVGQGGGQLSLQAECIRRVDAARVGAAASTFYIGADIGQGFGPVFGGAISHSFNYTVMFVISAVLISASMAVFNIYQKKSGYQQGHCLTEPKAL